MLNKGKYARNVEKAERNQRRLTQLLTWLNELDRLLAGVTLALGDFRQLLGRSNTCSNLQVIENAARTSYQCDATPYFAVAGGMGDALRGMFSSKKIRHRALIFLGRTNISYFFMRR
ncbi:hypothetical protein XENORESO_011851 [Xenotaenia resolanae]|uniref:Uncharacterized protein n=1 Tax=Xenotaenia resolanae TaxID=208358 RepID=A0ABV0VQL9_9TELE